MDEKTEELRDLFEEVTGEDTVTETQEETPGSLAGEDEDDLAEGLAAAVARMRETYDFETELSDAEHARVARGYYEGEDDTDIAEALDVDRREVVRARLDVHLVRDRDRDAPFDLTDLRELLNEDRSTGDIAAELDVSPSTVRRYRRVVRTEKEIRSVSARYQADFEDVLTDAGISHDMTRDMKEDGLEDATDGAEAESNMSL
ncbi:conditioned medium-induced protein 4 [Haloglomus irregulare]|uniref:Conditioned medium-induced protein 4 n=1 Tax=Haloglomus irregulare TaxID=2234134 RepID=A0A554NGM8_9EURY|nr:conditioned medium-induced protein 4 [Haloglomus irregulare]TSD16140.1 conditioned medium-induced protein 4 [Haloglomus irregulare]